MHRRLLLLIDGQRTPEELEYLLGRTQYEVQQVLHDLLALGLIRLS
jgi:predicted transcriptional regulator